MSVNRAEFSVAVKSTFDSTGTDQAKSTYAALAAQLKAMQADIVNAQRTGVSIPQESLDQLAKLEHSVANFGHVVEEAGVKTHEVKEALHLVGAAAGQALGPLGELGHFLESPYILAAAGAVLAIKMLVERHQELRDELEKNVAASREMSEALQSNYANAIRTVAESLATFHRALTTAGEAQNEFADRLSRQTALIHEQAEAVNSLTQARLQLWQANIQGAELAGQMTGPEGHAAEEHARREARTLQEREEHERNQRTVAAQRQAAADAIVESQQAAALAEARTPQRVIIGAAVNDLKDEAERRKKVAAEAADAEDKAKTAALAAGARPTAEQAAAVPGMIASVRAAHAAGATGIVAGEAEALDIENRIELYKKYDQALTNHTNRVGELETANKRLSEETIRQADFEAETTRLQNRAATLKDFAETTERAATAAERLNNATEAAHGPVDRLQDATEQQRRRNYLLQRHDQLTPDEQAEAEGAFDRNPRESIRQTQARITAIQTNVRAFEGGHVSPEEFRELQLLNDRILGLLENLLNHGALRQNTLSGMHGRIEALEQTVRNQGQRLDGRPQT